MRSNLLNVLLFLVAGVGLYFLMAHAEKNWFPKEQPKDDSAEREEKRKADEEAKLAANLAARRKEANELRERIAAVAWPHSQGRAAVAGNLAFASDITQPKREALLIDTIKRDMRWESIRAGAAVAGVPGVLVEPKREPQRRVRGTLIAFGDDTFYNKVLLTTEGGGVQEVILTQFNEATRLGKEYKDASGNTAPLYLIPGVKRVRPTELKVEYPVPDLQPGRVTDTSNLAEPCFTIFHYPTPDSKFPDPELGTREWDIPAEYRDADGNPKPKVLEDGQHEMVFETTLGAPYFVKFRKTYSLAPKDYHISFKLEITRTSDRGEGQLRYQLSGPRGLPIEGEWYSTMYRVALIGWLDEKSRARRQYEPAATVSVQRGGDEVPRGQKTFKYMAIATQYFTSAVAIDDQRGEHVTPHPWAYVRATTEVPLDETAYSQTPFFDDMTVRAASEALELKPDTPVEHRYVIYNGPAKVRLLGLMEGAREVDEGLVKRYQDSLGLKTITDFQSPTWLGSFANTIYWTDLVIAFTNLMHGFLAFIHGIIPSWALSIVLLTVVVRLILLVPSRKMTKTNMRMMEVQKKLAPQFEELKKKYAGDMHGYNRAKMQLMLANGVNPFAALGGCLLLLAQMPIMMGLYFCLQESVFFRLESFLWIDNLAAPDMTLWWTEKIPFISTPESIGGMLYMGPYLNILPIIAVVLMFWQQLKMLPPPTDEQARQQRFMMKMMMVMMPIFFYKFAAGLAIYFIISTLWGLAERKLIPKPDVSGPAGGPGGGGGGPGADPEPPKPKGWLGRKLQEARERIEEMKKQADEQSKRQIRNEPRGEQPKEQGQPGQSRQDRRRDKKKRRRR